MEDESADQHEVVLDELESDDERPGEESEEEDGEVEEAEAEAEAEETQQQAQSDNNEDGNDMSGDDGVEPGQHLGDSCLPIIVNDRRLMVTPNIYDALCLIRTSKLSRHRFWIDAICIDQQHIDERDAQVILMGGIYESAEKVIVWLGKENASSGKVLSMVSQLAHSFDTLNAEFDLVGRENLRSEAFRSFRDPHAYENPIVLRRLGLEDTLPSDWLNLYIFLQRRWFQRLWVAQEAVLSCQMESSWGPITSNFSIFKIATGSYRQPRLQWAWRIWASGWDFVLGARCVCP